jgi:hypothetical protein
MKAIHPFKIAGLLRAPASSASLIFTPSAFAERPYVVDPDLDRKIAADPGSLGRDNTRARAINDVGQVVREASTVGVLLMLLRPVQTAKA